MNFEPIAIIGQSCVLPGALTPQQLVDLVLEGKDVLSTVPKGYWRTDPHLVLTHSPKNAKDQTWSDRGGYVRGFESVFSPEGFAISPDEILQYDPLVLWVLHTAREALMDAGCLGNTGLKTGIIFGNLSYPSHGVTKFSEAVWLSAQGENFLQGKAVELAGIERPHPLNRFMSGLPAHIAASALELDADSFALDAACASSLYAIKLACDQLHDRKADVMLAGGVNRADDLIIHIGFCVLQAMSHTGRSRPFHKDADGLMPAEGAGFVALKRLDDAISAGDTIHGVIRAVGLSNDGRGHGLLVPSTEGQERAMRTAYKMSGLTPSDISLIECHATGTMVGDEIEVKSTTNIFEGLKGVPIGTIKSNIGHPITVSGIAGLIKVLGAFKAGIRPKTLHVEEPLESIKNSPFRLLFENEPWESVSPRRAAISNFGFGGNNAHLIVEEWTKSSTKSPKKSVSPPKDEIAIVGMGTIVADTIGKEAFAHALFSGSSRLRKMDDGRFGGFTESIQLPLLGLNFPPADLEQTLPQQLLILKAAMEAMSEVGKLPRERTCLFAGMGCDAEVSRGALGWRLKQLVQDWTGTTDLTLFEDWISNTKTQINPYGKAPAVLGAMPNIVANRISSQFDIAGPGFSISSEELSGIRGLNLAIRSLSAGEMDAAVVCAVDISCEQVHETAAKEVLEKEKQIPGDAAIVLILKRVDDARRDGNTIYAVFSDETDRAADLKMGSGDGRIRLEPLFGHAHAASGLVYIAAAGLACRQKAIPADKNASPWQTSRGARSIDISINAMGGTSAVIRMVEDTKAPPDPLCLEQVPELPYKADTENRKIQMTKKDKEIDKKNKGLKHTTKIYKIHPPLVKFPPLPSGQEEKAVKASPPAHESVSDAGTQIMTPPPSLPSVMGKTEIVIHPPDAGVGAEIINTSVNKEPVPPASVVPAPGDGHDTVACPADAPDTEILHVITQQSKDISTAHQAFLEQSAETHKQFLEQRENALSILTRSGLTRSGLTQSGLTQSGDQLEPYPEELTSPFPEGMEAAQGATAPFQMENLETPAVTKPLSGPPAEAHIPARIKPAGLATKPSETAKIEQKAIDETTPAGLSEPPLKPEKSDAPGQKKPTAMEALKAQFKNPVLIEPKGPTFEREQLKILASGKISKVFGPLFEQQDDHKLQVRLPEEPLLLADRIIGIDAEPGSMGKGILWTETDVAKNAWYLHDIYMPGGITIESGQCDLTLISYLGIDFLNKGKRVYRLLGCDLMYYGTPPKIGDTLCYQIHVDGHARLGDQRMFFFHYDCRVNGELRLSVRNGQAAFITQKEADEAPGVIWNPETAEYKPDNEARVDPPAVVCTRNKFSRKQVEAFAHGKGYECFGPGFENMASHSKTPKIPPGMMLLIDKIGEFDPSGGPWKRGYIRAENKLAPDAWYLPGHFKNDPCMPGNLMAEACMQLLAFYLAAMGFTISRDGWRFDPVPDEVFEAKCRSQITPENKELTYEAYIEEIIVVDGLYPTVFADLAATCDGRISLYIRRLGVRLVPDWPLECWPHLLENYEETKPVAVSNNFQFGYKSLLSCAWGKPSDAFGDLGKHFDKGHHIARLPSPPYHFMTRVTRIDATMGAMQRKGEVAEVEYDIPADVWYFDENGNRTMPFCVLMEVALQPCGWLSVFEGGVAISEEPLLFRNLDGTGTQHVEIIPDTGTILTRSKLTSISKIKGMALFNFDVECFVGDTLVYSMKTGFGFFLKKAFEEQFGLPMSDDVKKKVTEEFNKPSDFTIDLTKRPARYCGKTLRLAKPMLLMLDRITGYWPEGGGKNLGKLRAEKDVNIHEWFFKSHFFQDPVQPGSLGIEALIQLLQFYMIHENMDDGIQNPRFESIAIDKPITWRYRGQVVPINKLISSELDIIEVGRDEKGPFAVAEGWLWVDGRRIYHVKDMTVRIVEGDPPLESDTRSDITESAGIDISDTAGQENQALKKEVARQINVHPSSIRMSEDGNTAFCESMPLNIFPVMITDRGKAKPKIEVGASFLDMETITRYGRNLLGYEQWIGEDLSRGLCERFVRHLILEDPDAFETVRGKNVLYLANHQVQIESMLFPGLLQVLTDVRMVAIADAAHKKGWMGPFNDILYDYPEVEYPSNIVYFDQSNRESMFDILENFKTMIVDEGISVFLHAEGKLGLSCRNPIEVLSSVFIDLAQDCNLPIVPVRFMGGLPVKQMESTIDFPVGYGKQDYVVGRPIFPDELKAMPYAKRRKFVIKAINHLGSPNSKEVPSKPDPDFQEKVKTWEAKKNVSEVKAVMFKVLEQLPFSPSDTTRALINAVTGEAIKTEDNNGQWLKQFADWLFSKPS